MYHLQAFQMGSEAEYIYQINQVHCILYHKALMVQPRPDYNMQNRLKYTYKVFSIDLLLN